MLLCSAVAFAQVLPEQGLATPSIGAAADDQQLPAVVFDGTDFFSLWQDHRDGLRHHLASAHITTTGLVREQPSVAFEWSAGNQTRPALAIGGGGMLAAWLDDSFGCASEVIARRVGLDGKPSGPSMRLSTGACTGDGPAVAWNATASRWLVVWGAHGTTGALHGALVSAAGVEVPDFQIAAGPGRAAAMVGTAAGYLVVWQNVGEVSSVTVSASGTLGAVSGVSAPAVGVTQRRPCASALGADVLIAWDEGPGAGSTVIKAARVSQTGALLATSDVTTGTTSVQLPACTSTAAGAFITWDDFRTDGWSVYGAPVDPALVVGAELAVGPKVSYFSRATGRVAATGTTVLAVFGGDANDYLNGLDVLGTTMAEDAGVFSLTSPASFRVSTGASRARVVSSAFDGQRYFVTWRDDGMSFAGADIVGQLLSPSGQWLGGDAGVLLAANPAILQSYPVVAASDAGFFASYGDVGSGGQLYGQRISPLGVSLGADALPDVSGYVFVSSTQWQLDAWTTVWLWNNSVRLRQTATDGTHPALELELLPVPAGPTGLASAVVQGVFLAVTTTPALGGDDLIGARWSLAAGVLDPLGVTMARPGKQSDPALVAGGTSVLAVWSEPGDAGTRDVFAVRFSADSGIFDGAAQRLSPPGGDNVKPSAAFDGTGFVVVWERDNDVWGVRLASDGTVGTPFTVATSADPENAPHVTAGPGGEVLVTYERFDFDPAVMGYQARARRILPAALAPDGGAPGGGATDGGSIDGGAPDGGTTDGGATDGGTTAGGTIDGGTPAGGAPDGGGTVGQTGVPAKLSVGCNCGETGGWPSPILLSVLAWGLTRRSLRSRRRV